MLFPYEFYPMHAQQLVIIRWMDSCIYQKKKTIYNHIISITLLAYLGVQWYDCRIQGYPELTSVTWLTTYINNCTCDIQNSSTCAGIKLLVTVAIGTGCKYNYHIRWRSCRSPRSNGTASLNITLGNQFSWLLIGTLCIYMYLEYST